MARPRILCISLSPIYRDSRVLRQIKVLAEFGEVTTIGYGRPPAGASTHIEVPENLASLPQSIRGVTLLASRQWKSAELAAPGVAFAARALHGERYDFVVANEARVLGLAHAVADGAPVWGDMHEWSPEERTHLWSWRLLVAPFMVHLCARYLPISSAVTTVCDSIAGFYERDFGVETRVMRNSSPWLDLAPQQMLDDRIRLVHSGTAIHGRSLETMIDAVIALDDRFTLDLYLIAGGDNGKYLRQLKGRAQATDRIRFHPPVAPTELPAELNGYDVGLYWMAPTHTNNQYALPNKFFDFVQARLAIAVSPTIEMANLVRQYDLGIVGAGFAVQDCIDALRSLTAKAVMAAKSAADVASRDLSFESDAEVARTILRQHLS